MELEDTNDVQLHELSNPEAAKAGKINLKVVRVITQTYEYKAGGGQKEGRKLITILMSGDSEQYCTGVAKMTQRGGKKEMDELEKKWQIGSTWRFEKISLDKGERSAYISTTVKIAINLRASETKALLQSREFPTTPSPTITVANILSLKEYHRFDLMAIPTEISPERHAAGQLVCDCRLVDGSKTDDGDYASLPLTIWFTDKEELENFKTYTKKKPLIFMSVQGRFDKNNVEVSCVKNQFWWAQAKGTRADAMEKEAEAMCGEGISLSDVAALRPYTANTAVDFLSMRATLTNAKQMQASAELRKLLGDDKDVVVQLNDVYVVPPDAEEKITTEDGRLWAALTCWDASGKATLYFRSKAMCQCANLPEAETAEYKGRVRSNEIQHQILMSLRINLKARTIETATKDEEEAAKSTQTDAIVVEAGPVDTESCPNTTTRILMHGMLSADDPNTERMVSVPLAKLTFSAFYNMSANGNGAEKALALLRFPDNSVGKALQSGYRITSDRVTDFTDDSSTEISNQNSYGVIALCSFEKAILFRAQKDEVHLVVISKVVKPSKPHLHKADLQIEAMQKIDKTEWGGYKRQVISLQQVTNVSRGDDLTTEQEAVTANKCARLGRHPTI